MSIEKLTDKLADVQAEQAAQSARQEATQRDVSDLKTTLGETNKLLGEYNQQLAVHIAGVQEARKHNALLEASIEEFKRNAETRLQKLEAPHRWAAITYHVLKFVALIAAASSAIYGAIRFIAEHRPF